MRSVARLAILSCLTGCTAVPVAARTQSDAALREAESYAVAACLIGQKEPLLQDQGYGWAEVIVQGGRTDPDDFRPLNDAVKAEIATGDMAVIRDESAPQGGGKRLPILWCHEIVDKPRVRAAITRVLPRIRAATGAR